jgi:hypothetical protein
VVLHLVGSNLSEQFMELAARLLKAGDEYIHCIGLNEPLGA